MPGSLTASHIYKYSTANELHTIHTLLRCILISRQLFGVKDWSRSGLPHP